MSRLCYLSSLFLRKNCLPLSKSLPRTPHPLGPESLFECRPFMLDLNIEKGARFHSSGILDVSMHVKPSHQGAALSSYSRHLPSVHSSWVMSRIGHYQACCTSTSSFRAAVWQLYRKIVASDPSHISLGRTLLAIVHGRQVTDSEYVTSKPKRMECSRLILPYHPSLAGIPRLLQNFSRKFADSGFSHLSP